MNKSTAQSAWVTPTPCLRGGLSTSSFSVTHLKSGSSEERFWHHLASKRTVGTNKRVAKAVIQDVSPTISANETDSPPSDVSLGLKTVDEVTEPISLQVIGKLPSYLGTGTYYRNGPGVFEVRHKDGLEYVPEHWFDVIGMVHAFFLDAEKGTVQYRSRITGENKIRTIRSVRRDDYVHISFDKTVQSDSLIGKLRHTFGSLTRDPETGSPPLDVQVTLQKLPGKGILNASTDANVLHRLDPTTLEKVERYDFSQFNPNLNDPFTCAHGLLDERTGEYFNFMTDYRPGKVDYKVYRIGRSGETKIMATFQDYLYYLHSFALTENYVIMILWPCQIDVIKLLAGKTFVDACNMRADTPTKFVVISRNTDEIVCTYEHEQFFCFHTINAFEREDDIVIDLSWYKNHDIMKELRIDNMKSGNRYSQSKPVRFTLNGISQASAAGADTVHKAKSTDISNIRFEFGSVAPAKKSRPYKYAYGVSDCQGARFTGDVTKLDVETGQTTTWTAPGLYTGEPLFVPDPNGEEEDAGSLVVLVLDTYAKQSSFVVLDAQTMTETARAVLPMALPLGFHGFFQE